MTEPGWYAAADDPPGTQRWWDGNQWIGEPVVVPAPAASAVMPQSGTPTAGARIGARLIDLVIVVVILIGLVTLGLGTPERSGDGVNVAINLGSQALDSKIEYVLWGIVSFAWSALWIKGVGATPGKKLLRMTIAKRATGEPVTPTAAALRSANKLLPIAGILSVDAGEFAVVVIGTMILGFVSLIMMLSTDEGRTVMDRLSGTRVMHSR